MIVVTGGAGFIGSNFILDYLSQPTDEHILNIDKLTYASNLYSLRALIYDQRYHFVCADIVDYKKIQFCITKYQPRAIVHFAAESHVDHSIYNPQKFIYTNIQGTFTLLEVVRSYWLSLTVEKRQAFRFIQISTDEVYGTLCQDEMPFTEASPYAPNNPYAASKVSADSLVRAYHQTYGLPILITRASNNYGPYHLPDKLIPLIIVNALTGKELPIYGTGKQIRDWLYVRDHCAAIRQILRQAVPGQTYNIGCQNEKTNIDVVHCICDILDKLCPKIHGESYRNQIRFVKNRLGHDYRYSINSSKITRELNWKPLETFETGILKTVCWYINYFQ